MEIVTPTSDELAKLLAVHAARYPRKAKIHVLGDSGERVKLPVLLGIPTGAMHNGGAKANPAWQAIVERWALGKEHPADAIAARLTEDCLLWPDSKTFALWRERWPKLSADIGVTILRMTGTSGAVIEPSAVEEPPAEIAAALAAHPRAVWRSLRPAGGDALEVAIEAPDGVRFDAYTDAVQKPDADVVDLVRQLAEAQTVACVGGQVGEVFDRYPGLAIMVAAVARSLGGAQGEIALGEW